MNDSEEFEKILSSTKKLSELAELGEWEAVVDLEKERDLRITNFFKSPPNIDPETLADGLKYILDNNKKLIQYSHSQKDSVQLELSKVGHAHKSIGKYLNT